MEEEVAIKDYPPLKIIGIERTGALSQIEEAFKELTEWASKNKVHILYPSICLFYDNAYPGINPESAHWEVAFVVNELPRIADQEVSVKELPSELMATIIHHGPYETLSEAYNKILHWIKETGYETTGPFREVYVVCEENQPENNPENYVTEINFPVRKKEENQINTPAA
ncbi:MAG: GyrI-like domain-containing protein [Firmicutes bacterium]|nr:GyrI-like domain-containing protein [Bacillota bacterium]